MTTTLLPGKTIYSASSPETGVVAPTKIAFSSFRGFRLLEQVGKLPHNGGSRSYGMGSFSAMFFQTASPRWHDNPDRGVVGSDTTYERHRMAEQ